MDDLQISYDDLEEKDREIFLDIACFFARDFEQQVKEILDFRGFDSEIGLPVLVDKSLITISDGWICMHDLLRDLGKCIVQEKSPKEPRKWNRLWDYEDLYKVMSNNMPHKLFELDLSWSNIKQLWEGTQPLPNLRRLNVSYCTNLIEVRNVGEAPNFEELNLEGCVQLRQIHPSIGHLRKLTVLNLKNCKSLVSLPNNILGLSSLEYLILFGCSNLYNIHLSEEQRGARHLKKLRIGESPSFSQSLFSCLKKWLPWPSVAFDKSFEDAHKYSVRCLLPSFPIFSCMRQLDLSFCNLLKILDAFGNFHCLEILCLRGNNFETLPSLKQLYKLLLLNLQHCKRLKYLPELPSRTDLLELEWKSVENDEYVLGLNIFNCPELVERDCCSSICLSWMMQMVKALSKYEWRS